MTAVLLAVLASMMFGTGDFLGGFASRRAPALLVTLLAMLTGFGLLVPFAMFHAGHPEAPAWGWSIAAGVLGGLGVALLFHVLAVGPVATVSPVVAVCGVAMPAIAGLAWGERPGALALAGIAFAALAIVLVSGAAGEGDGGEKGHARARGSTVALAALSGCMLGGFLVGISRVPDSAGWWPLIIARLAGTVSVLTVLLARRVSLGAARTALVPSLFSGIADSAANVLYLWVVQQHPLSIVGTIVSLSPATVVTLARFVLHERFHRRQVAGLALAAFAIVLMTITKRPA